MRGKFSTITSLWLDPHSPNSAPRGGDSAGTHEPWQPNTPGKQPLEADRGEKDHRGENDWGWFRSSGSRSNSIKFWLRWGIDRLEPGYELDAVGASDLADRHYQTVINELEQLHADGRTRLTEEVIAHLALRHGIRLLSFEKYLNAEAALLTAVHLFRKTLANDSHVGRVRELAQATSWLAFARRRQGDSPGALQALEEAIRYWRSVVMYDGSTTGQKLACRSLAAMLRSYSRLLRRLGCDAAADQASSEARTLSSPSGVTQ